MIHEKIPKKIKGARKKRRLREKQEYEDAERKIKNSIRATVDANILAELYKGIYR